MHAVVAEAMKKAAIIWVSTAGDQPAYPLWCTSIGDALCVVVNRTDAGNATGDDPSATSLPAGRTAAGKATVGKATVGKATVGKAAADDAAVGNAAAGTEQPAPGLAQAHIATVTARGDHGGRIATWQVHVQPLAPGSDDWSAAAPVLASKRLNVSGSNDDLVTAWLTSATILRLTPVDDEISARSDSSNAAPARPTPAAARTAGPFRLRRAKRH